MHIPTTSGLHGPLNPPLRKTLNHAYPNNFWSTRPPLLKTPTPIPITSSLTLTLTQDTYPRLSQQLMAFTPTLTLDIYPSLSQQLLAFTPTFRPTLTQDTYPSLSQKLLAFTPNLTPTLTQYPPSYSVFIMLSCSVFCLYHPYPNNFWPFGTPLLQE